MGEAASSLLPPKHTMAPTRIDQEGVRDLVTQGAQLIEVLPADEFEKEHLFGARNIPLKELEDRHGELDRARPVIVYCEDSL
jgi:rhodanese-related sulfurtransferase